MSQTTESRRWGTHVCSQALLTHRRWRWKQPVSGNLGVPVSAREGGPEHGFSAGAYRAWIS